LFRCGQKTLPHVGIQACAAWLLVGALAYGSPTPQQKCEASKLKGAAKYQVSLAKCRSTAILKNLAVDPVCYAKAEAKLLKAVAKANDAGPCNGSTDALRGESQRCVIQYLGNLTLPVCDAGLTACGTECVNLADDKTNCGACDAVCELQETCASGSCIVPTCTGVQENCAGTCKDVDSDEANCGGCGVTCTGTDICVSGACSPNPCGTSTDCSGTCVDLQTDPQNCGGCGVTCPPILNIPGGFCCHGSCKGTPTPCM